MKSLGAVAVYIFDPVTPLVQSNYLSGTIVRTVGYIFCANVECFE